MLYYFLSSVFNNLMTVEDSTQYTIALRFVQLFHHLFATSQCLGEKIMQGEGVGMGK